MNSYLVHAIHILLLVLMTACSEDFKVQIARKSNFLPQELSIQSSANLVTRETYNFEWNAVPGVLTYEAVVAKDSGCSEEISRRTGIKETSLSLDFLSDGVYYLCVYSLMGDTRIAATNNGIALTIDKTEPLVLVPEQVKTYREPFEPSIKVEDLTAITAHWTKESGPGQLSVDDSNPQKPKISADTDGIYSVKSIITDKAGNKVKASYQFLWDTSGPSVNLGSDLVAAAPMSYSLTVDSSAVSFAWSMKSGPAGGKLIFSQAEAKITLISADKEGRYEVTLQAFDQAGNVGSATASFQWDQSAPTFTQVDLAGPAVDGFINGQERNLSASLVGSIMASDYVGVAFKAVPVLSTCNGSLTYSPVAPLANSEVFTADGSYKICVELSDAAQLKTYGSTPAFIIDTVPANITSMSLIGDVADGILNASEHASANPLVGGLLATDNFSLEYALVRDGVSCVGPHAYSTVVPKSNDDRFASAGNYRVCVRVSDLALNPPDYEQSELIQWVPGAGSIPVFISLQPAAAAIDGYINDSEKLLVSALWGLNASGYTQALYTTAFVDASGNAVCDSSLIYDQSSIASPASLIADGDYSLCVKLSDASGNTVFGKAQPISRDVVAPVFTSLVGASEAADLMINLSDSSSSQALFTLTASGFASEVYTVALSDDPSAVTCTGALTYSQATIPLISSLSSNGKFAVCAKLTDVAGNISFGKSQQIERNIAAPSFVSLLAANGASDGVINDSEKASTSAAWTLNGTGQAVYSLPSSDAGSALVCDESRTYDQASIPALSAITSDGVWAICVKLTNAAGNVNYGKSQQIIRDTVLPTFTSLVAANGASDGFVNGSEAISNAALLVLTASAYTTANYTPALDNSTPISCDNSQDYSRTTIPSISSLASDTSYAVCVKLEDASGNLRYGKSDVIIRDTAAPTFTSLVRAAEAADTYLNFAEKDSTSALWTLSASGHSSVNYTTGLDDTGASLVCDSARSYTAGTTPATGAQLSSDGTFSICVKLSDAAGNVSYGKGQQVIRDTVAPAFASLSRANAASDGFIVSSEYLLVNAMWSLSASGHSNAAYTEALNDSASSLSCGSGLDYSMSTIATPATLIADGAYALCVKVSDAAGNITFGKSDQITRGRRPLVNFSQATRYVLESDSSITVTVELSRALDRAVSIPYTVGGTASNPADHNLAAGNVTVNSGALSGSLSFQVVSDANNSENETVTLTLGTSDSADLGYTTVQTINLLEPSAGSLGASSLTIKPANGSNRLEWIGQNSPVGYMVVRGLSETFAYSPVNGVTCATDAGARGSEFVSCVTAPTRSLLDTSLSNGTHYYYKVYAFDSGSNYGTDIALGSSMPNTSGVSIQFTPAETSVGLNWSGGSSENVMVIRDTSAITFTPVNGSSYSSGANGIIYLGSANNYSDTGLTAETTYYYTVYGYDAANNYLLLGSTSITTLEPPPVANFAIASQTFNENDGQVTVSVNLDKNALDDVSIPYTVSGTALYPSDHDLAAGTLSILEGSQSGQITFNVVRDAEEVARTVVLTMGTPINATKGTTVAHTVTISEVCNTSPQVFTSSTTITASSLCSSLTASLWGGGGAGGTKEDSNGGNGGGGGYATVTSSTSAGQTIEIYVGTGGACSSTGGIGGAGGFASGGNGGARRNAGIIGSVGSGPAVTGGSAGVGSSGSYSGGAGKWGGGGGGGPDANGGAGGGGGASALVVNSVQQAIAGGGGGGGGGDDTAGGNGGVGCSGAGQSKSSRPGAGGGGGACSTLSGTTSPAVATVPAGSSGGAGVGGSGATCSSGTNGKVIITFAP